MNKEYSKWLYRFFVPFGLYGFLYYVLTIVFNVRMYTDKALVYSLIHATIFVACYKLLFYENDQ